MGLNSWVERFRLTHPFLFRLCSMFMSVRAYFGLHLITGLSLSALFVELFTELVESLFEQDTMVRWDLWVARYITNFQSDELTRLMGLISNLGGAPFLGISSLAGICMLLWRRKFAEAFTFGMVMSGGVLLNQILKNVIHRSRPSEAHSLAQATGFSFPSGHAMMSTLFYGLLTYFLIRSGQKRDRKLIVSSFLLGLVLLIGMSRIYLEVHYLSDVVAGFVGALFYLTLCLTGFEIYQKNKKM